MCESIGDFINRVNRYEILSEGREKELLEEVELWGVEILDRYVEELEKLLKDPCMKRLEEKQPWYADEIRGRIRKWALNARRRKAGEPEVDLRCESEEVYDIDRVHASLVIRNPRIVPLECDVSIGGDFKLHGQRQPIPLRVEPLSSKVLDIILEPATEGNKTLLVVVSVKGSYPSKVERGLTLSVKRFDAKLEVRAKVLENEVYEGENVTVILELLNTGTVPLDIELRDPFSMEPKRVLLDPNENRELSFNGRVPDSGIIEIPPVKYVDSKGNVREKGVGKLSVKVKKGERGEKEPAKSRASEREEGQMGVKPPVEPQPTLDFESILMEIAKHATAALLGKFIGERFPEERRYPKQVLIEDLPHYVHGDTTVVFEDPSAVVEEDLGGYVRIRRAKPAELEHIVTSEAAKTLVSGYKFSVDAMLRSWKPFPEAQVSKREVSITREFLKELAKREGKRLKVEDVAERLPENFYIEYLYREEGFFGRKLLRIYAGACTRLKTLLERERDDKPISLGEAFTLLELPRPEGRVVYLLASPTGWDSSSRDVARSTLGDMTYVLLNLKTGEVYYNAKDETARALVEALGYEREPIILVDEITRLDKLLLEGKITEEVYRSKLSEVLRSTQDLSYGSS